MNTNCGLNENGALVKDAVDMIGEIKILAQSSIPSNCLPCNGAAISRAAYPELFAAIGTTYGAGDGSTTFNVPDAEGVLYGNQGRTVGAAVAEGLPDITGALSAFMGTALNGYRLYAEYGAQGAFIHSIHYNSGIAFNALQGTGAWTLQLDDTHAHIDTITFDAYDSNPIYGASTHVQPQGITFNVVIVFE